ncbi:hypothetical protein DUD79_06060 [Priestia aryabhattai]
MSIWIGIWIAIFVAIFESAHSGYRLDKKRKKAEKKKRSYSTIANCMISFFSLFYIYLDE